MKTKLKEFTKLNTKAIEHENKNRTMKLFSTRDLHLRMDVLFSERFHVLPNLVEIENIDCTKAQAWIMENYTDEIAECYHCNYVSKADISKFAPTEIVFVLADRIIICLGHDANWVKILYQTDLEKADKLIFELCRFKQKQQVNNISLLIKEEHGGIEIKKFKIKSPVLNIQDNYNDDFAPVHDVILKRLSQDNDKGLVLLHGKPGTGKTTYIRYLISALKKQIIFLPPNMAAAITDPSFISVLIDFSNSVFVIEDAENIITSREQNENSAITNLLNISDGLLSDCLNIQIICSFNTDIANIDNALLRKGRLIAKYEFKELQTEKAQQLSDKLGFTANITAPMTLTEIYNQQQETFGHATTKKIKAIGFNVEMVN